MRARGTNLSELPELLIFASDLLILATLMQNATVRADYSQARIDVVGRVTIQVNTTTCTGIC